MLSKTFLNKCLFLLHKVAHKYNNVSYGLTRFDNFVCISCQIWDSNMVVILKSFVTTNVHDETTFTNMSLNLIKFIEDNQELLC